MRDTPDDRRIAEAIAREEIRRIEESVGLTTKPTKRDDFLTERYAKMVVELAVRTHERDELKRKNVELNRALRAK